MGEIFEWTNVNVSLNTLWPIPLMSAMAGMVWVDCVGRKVGGIGFGAVMGGVMGGVMGE